MAKKSFLNKKELVPSVINAGIRGASAYGSQVFLSPMVGKMLPTRIQPYKGLLLASVGVLGEVMLKDPKMKAIAQGVSTQGIMDVANTLVGSKLGLGATETTKQEPVEPIDWEALAQEVENEFSPVNGTEEVNQQNAGDQAVYQTEETALMLS